MERDMEAAISSSKPTTDRKDLILSEIKRQIWLAGPCIIINVFFSILQIISIMFVGHLGEVQLSGASLATSMAGVTGFSPMVGLACALDTLCGQAFGAKKYSMLGVQAQRGMVVVCIVFIPVTAIWVNVGKILLLLKQDVAIANEAGIYARWLIPGILAFGFHQCEIKFLQAQSIIFPMVLTSGITALLHLPLSWFLVMKSGLGSKGSALSLDISYILNAILLGIYIKFSPRCKNTWNGFSKEAFRDLKIFAKLGVQSAFMVCLELWSYETIVIASGILPNPDVQTSVLAISLNTMNMMYTVVLGLGSVASIRVSNELGSGQPRLAKLAMKVMMSIITVEAGVACLGLFFLRNIWGKLYSNEPEVLDYISSMAPLISISAFLDAYQCGLSGVARGCGRQKICAFINFGAYYIIGLPLAFVFGFLLHLQGKGLWMGMICAIFVQLVCLIITTIMIKWDKEAINALKRTGTEVSAPSNSLEMTQM
ncbi:MATE efflux family protein [Zostera marina]|uniref:Protein DETOXIFICATION n=1 Tax=Zostera marina TaxID=29655 RepID=A0A0K9Q2B9_ZOSMR|nr:MATE efflux family protein [Zostera marina]